MRDMIVSHKSEYNIQCSGEQDMVYGRSLLNGKQHTWNLESWG